MKRKRHAITAILLIMAMLLPAGCQSKHYSTSSDLRTEMDNLSAKDSKDENEELNEEVLTTSITFVNNTGINIYYLYASPASTNDWEEDILDIDILEYGQAVQVDFTYLSSETIWDFKIVDGDRNALEFYDIDFADYGSTGAAITLNADGTADIMQGTYNYNLPEIALNDEDIYAPILSEYYDFLKNGISSEEFLNEINSDLSVAYSLGLKLDSVGYAFFDIDGNGVDELFIGFVYGSALSIESNMTYGIFIDSYCINTDDSQIYRIATSNRNAYYYLCTDGLIGKHSSSIPYSQTYEFFQLNVNEYYSIGAIKNNIEEGSWYVVTGNQQQTVTYTQANSLINEHSPMTINFTPFSQFQW